MRYVLIAYDMVRSRTRSRLARRLLAVLPRVQKSVFEGPTDDAGVATIREAIVQVIDHPTDTVRLLTLCATCREAMEVFGTAERLPLEAEDVVLDGDER